MIWVEKSNSQRAGIRDIYTIRALYLFLFIYFFIGLVNKYRHGSETHYTVDILTFDSRGQTGKKI
jgi:hypothetical protein